MAMNNLVQSSAFCSDSLFSLFCRTQFDTISHSTISLPKSLVQRRMEARVAYGGSIQITTRSSSRMEVVVDFAS